jgi:hypothetical protein
MPTHSHRPPMLALTAAVLLCPLGGCSTRPARVPAPRIDPAAIAAAVFEKADADRDGRLRGAEQQTVPSIAMAAGTLDADGNGGVTREELASWLEAVRDSRVAVTSLEVIVTQRGRPLAAATVRLVPEPFMGAEVKAAEGVTDAGGVAAVTIPDAKYPGVNCGLYRVEITGAGNDGKPLPEGENKATRLGVAVGAGIPETGSVEFRLD